MKEVMSYDFTFDYGLILELGNDVETQMQINPCC